jgi:predicted aminopeptidase
MKKLWMALILSLLASSAFAGDGSILRARGKPIPGQYIVQFTSGQDARSTVNELALNHAARVLQVYEHALHGAAFQMSEHAELQKMFERCRRFTSRGSRKRYQPWVVSPLAIAHLTEETAYQGESS